ncbi:hypothetical protein J2W55_003276 [Mucilaginibacter pocheonensis]|uniref:Uncharacterized protein n=1 Tax=Mucilaginibacter pocheonensis TaxID=398050 RepID=A0ABU1TDG3_9SPHI|nr:hypothetical protein [Mucilaginibacter pocheonensis]
MLSLQEFKYTQNLKQNFIWQISSVLWDFIGLYRLKKITV